jgi:hypothetical protein
MTAEEPTAHRVTWFGPDRPVEGGTVNVRPEPRRPTAPVEITVRDTETGETETKTITDDFVLICAGRHYLHHQQHFQKSGTHQLTVKVSRSEGDPS